MPELFWVVKTAKSKTLSHSEAKERSRVFSQAQRTSRRQKYHQASRSANSRRVLRANLASPLFEGIPQKLDDFCDWTLAERRGNAYFQEVAVHKILTLQSNLVFWKGQLPCIVQRDQGCRHLVVAIAATFELLFLPNFKELNLLALEQCNKATQYLRAGQGTQDLPLLLASCILVCAYNLLRGDLAAADRSIQCGNDMSANNELVSSEEQQPRIIIKSLLNNHGYAKLWAPDVGFRFDKTMAGQGVLELVKTPAIAPFTEVEQVLAAFRTVIIEYTAKCMRNLSLGAHIDPSSFFAREVCRCFSDIFLQWKIYHRLLTSVPGVDNDERILQLEQLKIGILSAYVLFMGKVLNSDESQIDKLTSSYQTLLDLGKRVVAARLSGRRVIYMGRIVNSSLYASALICREPHIRRDLIQLLKIQLTCSDDADNGLTNYLRGLAAECIQAIEERDGGLNDHTGVMSCHDIPLRRRVIICDLTCSEERILSVHYVMATELDRLHVRASEFSIGSEIAAFTVDEINAKLQQQMTGTKMYMKADCYEALPDGSLKEMIYDDRPVPVRFTGG